MKKFIFSLFAFAGMTITASAGNSLSIADVKAAPGETVTATLVFSIPENTYAGFVFAFQFPETGFSIDPTSEDAVGGIKNFQVGEMVDGFVKISGAATNTFAAAQEFTVQFTVDESVTPATYPVTVTAQLDNDGTMEDVAPCTFNVVVKNLETVTLSENNTTALEASDGAVIAKVERTIAANQWSTICLPFDVTGEQLKTAFGDDVKIAELSKWSCENSDWDDQDNPILTSIKIVFANVDIANGIKANQPYMIKVSSAVSEFEVKSVLINPSDELSIGKTIDVDGSTCTLNMQGSYVVSKLPKNAFFVNDNKMWYNDTRNGTTMKAFRASFRFQGVNFTEFFKASEARVTMEFGDETTDSIININKENQNDEYYNLGGQRVDTPAKGIYIKNGKKVVVK